MAFPPQVNAQIPGNLMEPRFRAQYFASASWKAVQRP
jgi:hypothetical protein